jgi:hypothetical protein
MTMLLGDNSTGEVYWVRDYTMTVTEVAYYAVTFEISGSFYDPDYGFVLLSTPVPFLIDYDDDWPSEGVLVLTGDTGIAGGSIEAQLTALSSITYRVEADTNGDGFYDWNSGVLYWSDL